MSLCLTEEVVPLASQIHRAWVCGVCCLLQCGFSWTRRDLYLQATSFPESADRLRGTELFVSDLGGFFRGF